MASKSIKSLLVLSLSALFVLFAPGVKAQEHEEVKKEGFNAKEVIFGHIMDAHEFHFLEFESSDGQKHPLSIPLPVILYSPQKGVSVFMASKFEHGHAEVDGYKLNEEGKIVPVDANVKVYDLSPTRNVVQMILALALLCWLMVSVAKIYKKGQGVVSAPKGKQNLVEVLVIFIRDEVAKPNLGHKVNKYLPFLLTVFFFILINALVGLIPGSANVAGNIAFTLLLGVIAFIVILASSNKHYWTHILNPPGVPLGVKFILIPVEILSVFIKPFALIIRLFANMVAGHIIIICLISMIFIFGEKIASGAGWGISPVSVAFTIFIYFIEILVAFLQAFIFVMLTAVFIGQAFEGEHHEGEPHLVGEHDDAIIV
ncbi:MAG: F0F1 ATP synthase subunit A [Bacteroidetes bacterium]|nr:F0F1 ATP synthase subunit A [Bacteroidota bacterium]MBS1756699.1 F0F1 ATP synthase subunit A [Bacteroidota bacterium]